MCITITQPDRTHCNATQRKLHKARRKATNTYIHEATHTMHCTTVSE